MLTPRVRKAVDWVVGSALILFGIAAGLVPVLPGWLFVVAGLAVLSSHSHWARRLHERFHGFGTRVRKTVWGRRTDSSTNGRQPDE